jgi:Fic family protein
MSSTARPDDGGKSNPPAAGHTAADPLAPLAALQGVPEAVASVRKSVDRIYGHRVMRRRSSEVSAEAALRAARATAAVEGVDWSLEEVRRRSDFGTEPAARTVGAALRVTAEAGQLHDIWQQTPLRVLARLHLVAASGLAPDETVGRPRRPGEPVDGPDLRLHPPGADEVAARLEGLAQLITGATSAPALVISSVVHGELQVLRPFGSYNGEVARAAERVVLVAGGLDPKAICPAEVGHAELGQEAYLTALGGYASGTPEGMTEWITHCGRAVELGVRETTAVCEAMQRGAA